MSHTPTVGLGGVRLEADEAIAVILGLAEGVGSGELDGIPAQPADLAVASGGRLRILSNEFRPLEPRALARLLDALLNQADGQVRGGVRLAIARALGLIDLPPFTSAHDFLRIVVRFAPADPGRVLIDLYSRLAAAPAGLLPTSSPSMFRLRPGRVRSAARALGAAAALALIVATSSDWIPIRSQNAAELTRAASRRDTLPATPGRTASPPASYPSRHETPGTSASGPSAVRAVAGAFSPSFAPGGEGIYFHTGRTDAPSALVRSASSPTADMRLLRIVDDGASNYHVRPSPDGRWIAFDSDREGDRAVYVARADGKMVRRVSETGYAAVPSWAPDGRRLAFVKAEPERPRVWNVWIADVGGSGLRRITAHSYGQPWGASWFPDGRRIAYSHEDRVIVLDLETGSRRVFPSPRPGRLLRTPAVSPDGERIIYQVYRDGAWLLDVADGRARRILADPTAEEFAWDPSGRRVAFHSRRRGGWSIYVMGAG